MSSVEKFTTYCNSNNLECDINYFKEGLDGVAVYSPPEYKFGDNGTHVLGYPYNKDIDTVDNFFSEILLDVISQVKSLEYCNCPECCITEDINEVHRKQG